jgi:cytochrome c oxidase assembly factor CtaG
MHARVMLALLHAGAPLHHLWSGWVWEPGIVLPLAAGAILYGRGLKALGIRGGADTGMPRARRGMRRWETTAFWTGWGILVLALVSPVHLLSEQLFSVHMVQHELLMVAAAPLLVLGRPLVPFLWALPLATRQQLATVAHRPAVRAVWSVITRPVGAWMLHAAAIWIWHVPRFFELTLANAAVHALQHACFLFTGLLFWWSLVHGRRAPHEGPRAAGYVAAVLYLFTTALHTSALGALITFSPTLWYPAYGSSAASWNLTPLEDQQLAGLIMWIPGSVGYLIAALLLLAAALRAAEARSVSRERADAAALWPAPSYEDYTS